MLSAFKTYRRRRLLLYTYHKMDVFFAGIDTIKFCKGIYGKLPKPFEDFKTTQTLYYISIGTYISSIQQRRTGRALASLSLRLLYLNQNILANKSKTLTFEK